MLLLRLTIRPPTRVQPGRTRAPPCHKNNPSIPLSPPFPWSTLPDGLSLLLCLLRLQLHSKPLDPFPPSPGCPLRALKQVMTPITQWTSKRKGHIRTDAPTNTIDKQTKKTTKKTWRGGRRLFVHGGMPMPMPMPTTDWTYSNLTKKATGRPRSRDLDGLARLAVLVLVPAQRKKRGVETD